MQHKKIALVSDAWVPQVNGVVRTFQSIIPILEKKGFEIKILHPEMYNNFSYPWYKEIKISYNTKKITKEFFESFNPDIIHIITEGPVGFAGRKYCNRNNLKYTSSFHTRFPDYIKQRAFIPKTLTYSILRSLHNDSYKVLVPSDSMIQELKKYNFKNLKVWNRGVDTKLFDPNKRNRADKNLQLTYVGRVAIEKNIEAFLNLKGDYIKTVVGDGPELQKYIRKYPEVNFVGLKEGEELAGYYANADVFVFPSKTDTLGNVILEALACGTPIAAFPVTGPKDILQNSNINTLDENLNDSVKKALKVSRNDCRNFALKFKWDDCTNEFLQSQIDTNSGALLFS